MLMMGWDGSCRCGKPSLEDRGVRYREIDIEEDSHAA